MSVIRDDEKRKINLNAKIKLLSGIDKKPFELHFYKFGELALKSKNIIANKTETRDKLPPVPKFNVGYIILDKLRHKSSLKSRNKSPNESKILVEDKLKNLKEYYEPNNRSLMRSPFGENHDETFKINMSPNTSSIRNSPTHPEKVESSFEKSKTTEKSILNIYDFREIIYKNA